MVKTKTKNIHTPLVFAGYMLFALLIISILLSTVIPFGRMLFTPHVIYFNVVLFTVSLTIGAILPVLIGYLIGNRSLKSSSKLTHHFNGILFGLLAYWIMTIVSMLISIRSDYLMQSPTIGVIVINTVPSIIVALTTAILAVTHVRSHQARQDILQYTPYSMTLIVLTLAMPLFWSLLDIVLDQTFSLYPLIQLAITLAIATVSYATLRSTHLGRYSKVVWSAVSVSIAYVLVFVLFQLVPSVITYLFPMPSMEFLNMENILSWILAILGWSVYWVFQVRSLSGKR